jgi:hypothetical protein
MTALRTSPTAAAQPLSMPAYIRTSDHLSPTTRHLCTAAFLLPGFANAVVRELIGDSLRSVPPSHGFDLDPVIRQCFRARALTAQKLALATVLYLIALVLSPPLVAVLTALGGVVRLYRSPRLRVFLRRHWWARWLFWYLVVSIGLAVTSALTYVLIEAAGSTGSEPGWGHPGAALLMLTGAFVVLVLFRRHDYQVVTREFVADAPHQRRKLRDSLVEDRLAVIAGTQRGNVVVHHDNPFLGCGAVQQGWSLSMTLRPKTPSGDGPRRPVDVDPVTLNERLKQAIGSMRAPWLDEGQRVAGISVRPYVVADGVRAEDDPLIDPVAGMPYTMAGDETVDAIVANPQGGLRQYLRVVIPVRGKAIRDGRDEVILGAQALGISVNVFVHVAVEGGMLYAESIGTVLPPLRPQCLLADALRPERAGSYAFGEAARGAIVDVVAAPFRLVVAAGRSIGLHWAMHRSAQRAREFRTHDYGARVSVREMAAIADVESYLQKLDGIKYVKLVDRIVSETIIDFLVEAGVDPLEFRQAVAQITLQNSSLVQVGTIQGGQNNFGGDGNAFITTTTGVSGA